MTNVMVWSETAFKTGKCMRCGAVVRDINEGADAPAPKWMKFRLVGFRKYGFCKCGQAVCYQTKSAKTAQELKLSRLKNGAYWGDMK